MSRSSFLISDIMTSSQQHASTPSENDTVTATHQHPHHHRKHHHWQRRSILGPSSLHANSTQLIPNNPLKAKGGEQQPASRRLILENGDKLLQQRPPVPNAIGLKYVVESSATSPPFQSPLLPTTSSPNVRPDSVMSSSHEANLDVPLTPLSRDSVRCFVQETPRSSLSVLPCTVPPVSIDLLEMPIPQLQNIVSTVNMGVKLDLQKIVQHARNTEYNPKRFSAVVMRIREPRTTALIFASGKLVCTGAKSVDASRLASRKFARIIQKIGFPAKFTEFKVQNLVGSCDVGFQIHMDALYLMHGQFAQYDPELFPGLIYRMTRPRVVLMIFLSGKVVITGAKCRQEVDDAFSQMYPILKGFRK